MSVMLKKEMLQTNKILTQKYSQTTVDCDVIVPDINPDIQKILDIDGHISISEKVLRNNKIHIQGNINMTVLYLPDGEVLSMVKSISASQSFTHTIDVASDSGNLVADIEPECFNYTLINSRKINLRCTLGINCKLTEPQIFEVSSAAEENDDICVKTEKIRICDNSINSENRIVICGKAEVPSGSPSASELLKTSVVPEATELILTENSALAKGKIKITFLYTSLDDGSVQIFEHSVPFEEELDVDGIEEDMEAEIEYILSDMHCEIRDDFDGEPRIIGYEIGLSAVLRGVKIYEPEIVYDAYSLSGKAILTSEPIKAELLVGNTTAQLTHKSSIKLPQDFPEISKICNTDISASVERIVINDNEITVLGMLKTNILYMSNNRQSPLCSFSDTSEFSHSMPYTSSEKNTVCDAKVFIEHTSYNLTSSDSLELRVVMGLSVRLSKEETITPISQIDIESSDAVSTKPYIRMLFVQEGDTLWSIAKHCKTTVDSLMEYNSLTDDNLSVGQILKIC